MHVQKLLNVFTLGYIFRYIIELVHTYPAIYNLLLHIWVFMYYVCIVIYIGMLKLGHGIHLCKFCTIHLQQNSLMYRV